MRRARPFWILLLTGASALLGGCLEVQERLALEASGGGEYSLSVRYDADLLRRITSVVGEAVVDKLRGRDFPLRADQMAASLEGLSGLRVVHVHEQPEPGGWRHLQVRVAFDRLSDLLAWEVLAGRSVRAAPLLVGGESRGTLSMAPLEDLPLLDPLIDLLDVLEHPPAIPSEAAREDPGPLARLGVAAPEGKLVQDLLLVALKGVQVGVVVAVPGPVTEAGERATRPSRTEASFQWDFEALRAAHVGRGVSLGWHQRELDEPIVVEQEGDASSMGARGDRAR